jgi:hypothetical protein
MLQFWTKLIYFMKRNRQKTVFDNFIFFAKIRMKIKLHNIKKLPALDLSHEA